MMRGRALFGVMVCALWLADGAEAQQPPTVRPGTAVAFEVQPGRMASGTTTVARPPENLAFDWLIDGGTTPVAATRRGTCLPGTAVPIEYTCQVILPDLTEGSHTLRLVAKPNPAESGVSASQPGDSLTVAVIIVLSPGSPRNLRPAP